MSRTTVPSTVSQSQYNQNDMDLSKTLHADSWHHANHRDNLFSKLKKKDYGLQPMVVEKYLHNWNENSSKNEIETEESKAENLDGYKAIANAYYDLVTDFYEYAWGTSFHFCRFHSGEPFQQAMARHEHYLAAQMGIQSNLKVLDMGCGVGGPAREISHFTGAHITGINNNDYQISRAIHQTVQAGMDHRCEFVKGDFIHMPFEDNSFDACYGIESTVHAKTLEDVYGEAYRVLKPGGVFGCYEYLMTDKYDPSNPEHLRVLQGLQVGGGIADMTRTEDDCLQALRNVGFTIEKNMDLARLDDKIKWHSPLQGDIRQANVLWDYLTYLRTTSYGRTATAYMLWTMEKLRLVSPGSVQVSNILEIGADSFVKGGVLEIFTPMYFFIVRKPASA
ncbi:hypothetical protein BGX28_002519 [Mortierella sp. GBA30]|nr:hypothetical protein BGX28_002519 [Mortierella sp. GBA30]